MDWKKEDGSKGVIFRNVLRAAYWDAWGCLKSSLEGLERTLLRHPP